MKRLTSDLVYDLWGGPSALADAIGTSKQRVSYWIRQEFAISNFGEVFNNAGRVVAQLPTHKASKAFAASVINRLPDHYEVCPFEMAGHYAGFLPLAIGGRLATDTAPASVWREAMKC